MFSWLGTVRAVRSRHGAVTRMNEHRTKNVLKRVAQALNVSEDAFFEDRSRDMPTVPAISEELELLRLFSTVTDPEARRTCLRYVQSLADAADMAAG